VISSGGFRLASSKEESAGVGAAVALAAGAAAALDFALPPLTAVDACLSADDCLLSADEAVTADAAATSLGLAACRTGCAAAAAGGKSRDAGRAALGCSLSDKDCLTSLAVGAELGAFSATVAAAGSSFASESKRPAVIRCSDVVSPASSCFSTCRETS